MKTINGFEVTVRVTDQGGTDRVEWLLVEGDDKDLAVIAAVEAVDVAYPGLKYRTWDAVEAVENVDVEALPRGGTKGVVWFADYDEATIAKKRNAALADTVNRWTSADLTAEQVANLVFAFSMDHDAWAEFSATVEETRKAYVRERRAIDAA